jgi:hypothetical protein
MWMLGIGIRGLLVAAVIVGNVLLPHWVEARTFHCHGGDVNCVISAITQANVQSGKSHKIRLAAGTYTLRAVDNETDGLNGLPSISKSLTIEGAGLDQTIIERLADGPQFRLLHVAKRGSLTLQGLTLRGGFVWQDADSLQDAGGAILNMGGILRLASTRLTGNFAIFGGTGMWNQGGLVTMVNTTVDLHGRGRFGPGALTLGTVTNAAGGSMQIDRSLLVNNEAGQGGGVWNEDGTLNITRSTLARNAAIDYGGGLFNVSGTVKITASSLRSNGGDFFGGAIANIDGRVEVVNTTLVENAASEEAGGAIANSTGEVHLLNSTVTGNRADVGPGLYNESGVVALHNTLVAGNTFGPDGGVFGPDCVGSFTSLGHNLIGDLTDCTISLQMGDLTGESGLGELTDDRQPGHAHVPLLQGSQAINAGDVTVCPRKDQLGNPRVGICDIGAIELQPEGKQVVQR